MEARKSMPSLFVLLRPLGGINQLTKHAMGKHVSPARHFINLMVQPAQSL